MSEQKQQSRMQIEIVSEFSPDDEAMLKALALALDIELTAPDSEGLETAAHYEN